jgi:hypothetical protein
MSTVSTYNGIAIASVNSINGIAKASIDNWNGITIPSASFTGYLVLSFSGTSPANGDSVAAYIDGYGWVYSTVVGSTSTIEWESTWGLSGNTDVTVDTYGSISLEGNLTITAAQVITLNGGGTVNRTVTMYPL